MVSPFTLSHRTGETFTGPIPVLLTPLEEDACSCKDRDDEATEAARESGRAGIMMEEAGDTACIAVVIVADLHRLTCRS